VLAFRTDDRGTADHPLIRAFAGQTALALLRSHLEQQARVAIVLREVDSFQKTLLDSIAHNVRTPLASIIGALSTLQEDEATLAGPMRRDLLDTARQEAERLNRLLGNLLDLRRIESGVVRVRSDRCDVQDVIGAALEQLQSALRDRPIEVHIDPGLPPVPMDFVLIAQVIVNVLDNALKYSPEHAPIRIEARLRDDRVWVAISDEGDGIPLEHIHRVFDKFNRASRSGETGGVGLGLSICRCFVEVHRGSITVEPRGPSGSTVSFSLPLEARGEEAASA
jgi:two-component system sensor histidine kinase KdpD